MPKRINSEERILEYFESASADTAQATLNMIKAVLKRKQEATPDGIGRKFRRTAITKRKNSPLHSSPAALREVPETDDGAPRELPTLS